MILTKTFNSTTALAQFLRGSYVDSGVAEIHGTAGSPNIDSNGADAFADISVDDWVFINGDGLFQVITKTDDDNLVLDTNLNATHTGSDWVATQNPINTVDIIAISDKGGKLTLVWDSLFFSAAGIAALEE